jgi:hypothetical protein
MDLFRILDVLMLFVGTDVYVRLPKLVGGSSLFTGVILLTCFRAQIWKVLKYEDTVVYIIDCCVST